MVSAVAASRMLDSALRDARLASEAVTAEQMQDLLLGPIQRELERILPRRGLERNLRSLAYSLARPPRRGIDVTLTQTSAQIARDRTAKVISGVRVKPAPARTEHSPRVLQAAVLGLAAIDNVTLVAAVRSNGRTEFSRGHGDVEQLSRFGMLALSLLNRSGPLKTFFVAHERATLLLFPWGSDALLVTGLPELNVGAALTAFADLSANKEEP